MPKSKASHPGDKRLSRPAGYVELIRSLRVNGGSDFTGSGGWVSYWMSEFERTKNPVFIWEAVAESLSAGIAMPEIAREYLLGVAMNLGRLSRGPHPRKNQIAKAVSKALGLECHGAANPFRQLRRPGHEISVAMEVYRYQTKNQHFSMDAVFFDVASAHAERCHECVGISSGTVKKFWYLHARAVIPPHLFSQSKSQKVDDVLRQQPPSKK